MAAGSTTRRAQKLVLPASLSFALIGTGAATLSLFAAHLRKQKFVSEIA
jgi:hypothetical protein